MKSICTVLTAFSFAALLAIPGCGSLKRAGTDVAVVVTSPLTIPLSAAYDSLQWGEHTSSATPIVLFPFNFPLHLIKHAAYTICYVGDLFVSPLYLLAGVFSDKDLTPIDLYSLSDGYPWKSEPWPHFED